MKSGEHKKLQAVRYGREKIDYLNTCAFDSLHQPFLVTATVAPDFYERIVKRCSDVSLLCRFVDKIFRTKVTASSYRLRGTILNGLFAKTGNDELKCFTVNCSTTIQDLV